VEWRKVEGREVGCPCGDKKNKVVHTASVGPKGLQMGFAELEGFKVNKGLQGLQLKPFKNIKKSIFIL